MGITAGLLSAIVAQHRDPKRRAPILDTAHTKRFTTHRPNNSRLGMRSLGAKLEDQNIWEEPGGEGANAAVEILERGHNWIIPASKPRTTIHALVNRQHLRHHLDVGYSPTGHGSFVYVLRARDMASAILNENTEIVRSAFQSTNAAKA